jgi:hypothetical protein
MPAQDPAAVVLPALAALGSVAVIAAIPYLAQDRTPERGRLGRRAGLAIRDLEGDCLVLSDVFKRLIRSLKAAPEAAAIALSPIKFGLFGIELADAALMGDIARVSGSVPRNAGELMRCIEEGGIEVDDDVCAAFGKCQERLNQILIERASLKASILEGAEIAARLTELVRSLRASVKD